MKILPDFEFNRDISQLIYAVVVIILVPSALAFNTLFLTNNVKKDMNTELTNRALLVESAIAIQSRDKLASASAIKKDLDEIVTKLPEIKAVEIFLAPNNELNSLFSTADNTKNVYDDKLNSLAWSDKENQAYSKQMYASVGSSSERERIWLVVAPILDTNDKKLGIINLYISAAQIDALMERTTQNSIVILFVTIVGILLLLINHFRFFEISILFKKLSELDKLKDEFLSIASHELKTPLTSISGYAYILMRNPVINTDKVLSEQVYAIDQSSKRLKMLVEDILDVSRIEQNRLKLDMQNIDLREIIKSVVNELIPLSQMKDLKLEYRSGEQPLIVNCDKNKMVQIMTNLVGNAVKYTFKGGVEVYHEIDRGVVKTFVKDSGIGMSEEERSRLFSKFYRAYNDKTKDVSGTGLGLWITKQLVEKMRGKISAESIENQGSQFVVSFPLVTGFVENPNKAVS